MTTTHDVNMSLPQSANEITITGSRENIEMVKEELKELRQQLEKHNYEEQSQTHTKFNTACYFNERGNCNRGTECKYQHRNRSRSNVRDDRDNNNHTRRRSASRSSNTQEHSTRHRQEQRRNHYSKNHTQ